MSLRLVGRTLRSFARLAFLLASVDDLKADQALRLRAIDPKPVYAPGDRVALEMRCAAGVAYVEVRYNPTREPIDAGMPVAEDAKCPRSRFEIDIPTDFIGRNHVEVLGQYRGKRLTARFEFEVRSNVQPSDLWFSTDTQNEGCDFAYLGEGPGPQSVSLFSVLPDGRRFDLCREGRASAKALPSENAVFDMDGGGCTLTLKTRGAFRVVASYRGLRKEWTCTGSLPDPEAAVRATPPPAKTISIEEFLGEPSALDRHPAQIGECRTVEHWNTGYCYVFREGRGKVSVPTDDRCENVEGLRQRMIQAIRDGFCDSTPPPR